MLRDVMRIAEVVVPADIGTGNTVTEEMANLGVPSGEQGSVAKAVILGHRTAAGAEVAPAGGAVAISGANVVITEPDAGFTALDVVTVGFIFQRVPSSTGAGSTV